MNDHDRSSKPSWPAIDPELGEKPRLGGRTHRRMSSERGILLAIALGGVIGALARYGVGLVLPTPPGAFTWSTFAINLSGSLCLGALVTVLAERLGRTRLARPFLATGLLGAYTTFSTYMVDSDSLVRAHDFATAALYVVSSLAGGGAAVVCGIAAARFVLRSAGWMGGQHG